MVEFETFAWTPETLGVRGTLVTESGVARFRNFSPSSKIYGP